MSICVRERKGIHHTRGVLVGSCVALSGKESLLPFRKRPTRRPQGCRQRSKATETIYEKQSDRGYDFVDGVRDFAHRGGGGREDQNKSPIEIRVGQIRRNRGSNRHACMGYNQAVFLQRRGSAALPEM